DAIAFVKGAGVGTRFDGGAILIAVVVGLLIVGPAAGILLGHAGLIAVAIGLGAGGLLRLAGGKAVVIGVERVLLLCRRARGIALRIGIAAGHGLRERRAAANGK